MKILSFLSGQYSHPLRVVAFNTAEGWARDATEDIARAALDRARSENRTIGKATHEFLERTLRQDGIFRNDSLTPTFEMSALCQ